jgi:hypothetical protein
MLTQSGRKRQKAESSGVPQPAAGGDIDCQDASSVGVVAEQADEIERTFERCREVLAGAAAVAPEEHERKQIEVLKGMLADLKQCPARARVREMAGLLGVPQKVKGINIPVDRLFPNVQKVFVSLVLERRGCDATSSGGSHPADLASSGASSSGAPHPAEVINQRETLPGAERDVFAEYPWLARWRWLQQLPALDEGILQAVGTLGRYPKELNSTSSEEAKTEQKLARRIRDRWEDLLPQTRSVLNETKNLPDAERDSEAEYPWLVEIGDLITKICPRVPEHMMFAAQYILWELHLVKELRSREFLMNIKLCNKAWWKDAGIVERPRMPEFLCEGKHNRQGQITAICMQRQLGHVAYRHATGFLEQLESYYSSDNADAGAWQQYHMEWKRQLEERAIPTAVAMLTSGYPGPRTAHLPVNCHDGIVMTGPGIHFLEVEGSSQSSGEQHPAVIPVKSIPPELLEQLPR